MQIWDKFHENSYHPGVNGTIARIQNDINTKDVDSVFDFFEGKLDTKIELNDLEVMEIGSGGGWYLAQALRRGASHAHGVEISKGINSTAESALHSFGYTDFSLYELADGDLTQLKSGKVDFIYSITVFQHIPTQTLRRYLSSAHSILSENGKFAFQVLENNEADLKYGSTSDVLSMSYGPSSISDLLAQSHLRIHKYKKYEYDSGSNFWGLYLVEKE